MVDMAEWRQMVSGKGQLEEAARLGHELYIHRRTRDDFPDVPEKMWLRCTCGYQSTARRSEKAILGTLIWHLSKALAEADEKSSRHATEMRRNGIAPRHAS